MRVPPGISLLLVGSGIYCFLSSQLISSFTVLFPGLFQSLPSGQIAIKVVGTISLAAGLWIIKTDLDEFRRLTIARYGFVYVLPLALPSLDLYSTTVNLSQNSHAVELNPFVSSAIQYGPAAVLPFLISYLSLSQGLALLMLATGGWLFGEIGWPKILPFALICGASSFGPFSNLVGIAYGYQTTVYLLGGISSTLFSILIYAILKNATALRSTALN